jgi:hypothetical protein
VSPRVVKVAALEGRNDVTTESADQFFGRPLWDFQADFGPVLQVGEGFFKGDKSVALFLGDDMVILRHESAKALGELLIRLTHPDHKPDLGDGGPMASPH